jgi:hypothetical protein
MHNGTLNTNVFLSDHITAATPSFYTHALLLCFFHSEQWYNERKCVKSYHTNMLGGCL